MTVAEIEDRMSAAELGEWFEFFNLEPWGWEADCFRSGIVAATVANVHRDTSRKKTPFEASDFIPGFVKKPKKIEGKILKAQLQLAFAGMKNGRKNNLSDPWSQGDGESPKATRPTGGSKSGKQRSSSRRKANR